MVFDVCGDTVADAGHTTACQMEDSPECLGSLDHSVGDIVGYERCGWFTATFLHVIATIK